MPTLREAPYRSTRTTRGFHSSSTIKKPFHSDDKHSFNKKQLKKLATIVDFWPTTSYHAGGSGGREPLVACNLGPKRLLPDGPRYLIEPSSGQNFFVKERL